ncbi:MAG: DUF6511 domain-containing protein [Gammaproteobacteria bacterium]|nr:DUF6511 domain-containing protein [Gammaproteobacteria bacterium]
MIESPEQEHEARLAALRHWIGAVDSIGFEKPLSRYSKEEALRVVEAILTGWTQAMAGVSPCGQSSNKESR